MELLSEKNEKNIPLHMQLLITWILPLFLLCISSMGFANEPSEYQVLVLHSYNKGLTWTDNIQKGIESAFNPIADQLEMKVEYMDSKIVKFDEQFKTKLYELYKHKYSTSQFDVIISSDDNALTFLREYHKNLFPDVPIIFCGVNNISIPNLIDRNLFTGILEITAERETLDLALKLHPNTKKVVIICDNTPSGNSRWKQIERIVKDYPQLQFSRIDSSYSIEEIEEKMKRLPDDTIGFFATFYRDKSGQFFSLKEGIERVSSASRRPLYTYHAQVLPYGTVGGKLLSGTQHGQLAAELAQRIFKGGYTADIPIIATSLAQYMFNFQELKRFGINLSELPKGSSITGKPFSFYEEYKTLVLVVFFITFILTLIICTLVFNIIRRKKAELEIKAQKSFIQEALDAQNDTFFGFDPLTGKALQWNKAFENISGYSNKEISSLKAPESYYSNEDLAKASKYIQRILSGHAGTVELELICKDGHHVPFEYSASVLRDAEGNPKSFISIGRDISDRKKADEEKANLEFQLSQAQKMEAIGTLAGGIAHDFNNILSVIFGYIEMAREDTPAGTKLDEDLEQVLLAAHRAKELVKQILTFSRQSVTERIPLQIQPLIKEGLKMIRSSIPSTISITENIDVKSGIVLADPSQVHQILMNLCTNAYHAMGDKGGVLSVTLQPVLIGPDDEQKIALHATPGEYLELTVSDTGCGIGPDIIDKIFDPYFTTKGVGKGTGMGLAIIHGILSDYGGMITVDSRLGQGTTFHVFFPVVAMAVAPEINEPEVIPGGNERILFVDDEELLADMGKEMLERLGYRVTVRHGGVEALETFKNTPGDFDLVITDQTMPGITGSELSRLMLQIRPDIPIILCTGYSNLIDEYSARALGIKEFALKPLTKGIIANLIRKVLKEEPQIG